MASSTSFILTSLAALFTLSQAVELTLTVVNNCPYPVWPGIQPNAGMPVLQNGGFALDPNSHRSIPTLSTPWAGRIWGRTGCVEKDGKFSCVTGDCGPKLECGGQGGGISTIAEVAFHQGANDGVEYRVSVVDGYNLPMIVTPHEGTGQCPVVGCQATLLDMCPNELKLKHAADGRVIGCKSGCKALGKEELCCTGAFNSPDKCKPSPHSEFFKKACPNAITYPFDKPSLPVSCAAPKELKVIFCP
uniref:Uncharacterized protein n=1 Tax=Opuntia streptacantha TaxID=393608 RepID=A0A7C8YX00_OPUST